jgi:thiol-disulfide isomerase/thioredoxin
MKHFFTISAVIIFFIQGCQSPNSQKTIATSDSTYTITGKISGLDTGWIYLLNRQSEPRQFDSVRVNNGIFTFTGKADSPQFCLLGIPNAEHEKEYRLGFFVENGQMNISGKKDSIDKASITGSATEDEYQSFLASRKFLDDEENNLEKLYDSVKTKGDKRMTDSLEKIFGQFSDKEKSFIKEYVKKHPASYVSALEVYQNFSYDPDAAQLDSIYNNLALSIQNSHYGKKIKDVLDIAKKLAVGNAAPSFAQNNVSDKPISLASFKGKYVLVDFWASWCGPCRAENPNVVKVYQKYHPKGFDILGVSLDEKKDKWQEAIKKDNLNWMQVSDLQGWKNSVAVLYGVQGIPMNFLLNRDGKIIAKGLRGDDLEKKLDEVLK